MQSVIIEKLQFVIVERLVYVSYPIFVPFVDCLASVPLLQQSCAPQSGETDRTVAKAAMVDATAIHDKEAAVFSELKAEKGPRREKILVMT